MIHVHGCSMGLGATKASKKLNVLKLTMFARKIVWTTDKISTA